MQADPQVASRFEPFALPRWHESAALREFVVSFGRLLSLHKPSPFGDKAMIQNPATPGPYSRHAKPEREAPRGIP